MLAYFYYKSGLYIRVHPLCYDICISSLLIDSCLLLFLSSSIELFCIHLPSLSHHVYSLCTFTLFFYSSRDNYVCIGLFNSLGTTHIVCFQWPLTFMQNQHNHTVNTSSSMITSTSNKIQTKHKLINLPYESLSTGPLIMASSFSSSTLSSSNPCSTVNENNISSINDYIWLGTAGGGHCYCLDVQSGDFITRLVMYVYLFFSYIVSLCEAIIYGRRLSNT